MNNLVNSLKKLEFSLLSLLILVLPSLEAPKNIFLVLFLIIGLINQIIIKEMHSSRPWDWIFLFLIGSAFLTTLFPGMHEAEWKGLRVFLTSTLVGWLILRSDFSPKKISWLFNFIILGVIPPLFVGLVRYLYLHDKPDLQLHSVGHVNHSAIYLTIVLGASIGLLTSIWEKNKSYLNILLALLSILFFISLIISQSRAAVGIGFVLLISLFLILSTSKKIKIGGILFAVVIMIFSILLNTGVVQKQIRNEQANDILGARDKVWNISFEAVRWAPILGIGIDNWGKIKPEDIKRSVEDRRQIYNEKNYLFQGHSHSVYLMALVERGVVGFSALIFLMIGWIYYLIVNLKNISSDSQGRYLWAGSFSSWLVTFGIGFVNTTFHHEHGILACILLGLFVSYMTFNRKTIPGE
jgi:O-antigen ligase